MRESAASAWLWRNVWEMRVSLDARAKTTTVGFRVVGFDRETRAFHPHLTLGRVEHEDGAGAFRGLDDLISELSYTVSVPVRSMELMRSQTSRDGAVYSVLSSYPLAEG